VRREEELVVRDAVVPVVAAVGLTDVEQRVEAAQRGGDEGALHQLLRAGAREEAVRVAAEEQGGAAGVPGPEEAVGGEIVVAQKKHRPRVEGRDARAERGVPQAREVVRARVRAGVGDELVGVAVEQGHVPGELALEARVVALLDAEIPEVEDLEIEVAAGSEVTEPGRIVLDRVRGDDGELLHESASFGRSSVRSSPRRRSLLRS
jgi:hypothetical protein